MTLCALITLLVIKLAVTVMGALYSEPETTSAVPEAMAKDEKPKAEAETAAPVEKAAKSKPGTSTTDSLSVFQQKEIEIRKREEQLKEKEERLDKLEKEIEQKVKDLLALQKEVQSVRSREAGNPEYQSPEPCQNLRDDEAKRSRKADGKPR